MRAIAVLMLVSGCSFWAAETAPGREACMPDRVPVMIDAVAVLMAAAIDVHAAVCTPTSEGDGATCSARDLLAVGATILALPSLAGVVYGVAKKRCP